MLPEPALYLLLVLFGAWAGIDGSSVGQFMVSRPVVAATIAGWLAGDAASGALVGLLLEALVLTVLPVGAARYSEIGPAAVCAGAVFALRAETPGAMLTAVLFALSWAWVCGESVRKLRQANIRLVSGERGLAAGADSLERRHAFAIAADLARAAVLTAVGIPLLALIVTGTGAVWGLDPGISQLALWSLAAASIGAAVRLFGERRLRLFVAGAAGGLLLLLVL